MKKRILAGFLSAVLVVATALSLAACADNKKPGQTTKPNNSGNVTPGTSADGAPVKPPCPHSEPRMSMLSSTLRYPRQITTASTSVRSVTRTMTPRTTLTPRFTKETRALPRSFALISLLRNTTTTVSAAPTSLKHLSDRMRHTT